MFFVLSGFLITRNLSAEREFAGRINIPRFYLRRALRLLPAFGALLGFELLRALAEPARQHEILASVGLAASYMMNWNRAFSWGPQGYLGHSWSLAMEEQFYLLWPALLVLLRRRAMPWLLVAVACITLWRLHLTLAGAAFERTYNGFDTHADALLIGCVLAVLPNRAGLVRRAGRGVVFPLGLLAGLALGGPLYSVRTQAIGLSLSGLAAAWIVLAALDDGWFARVLSHRLVAYVGLISYGWYLWHYPLIQIGAQYGGPAGKLVAAIGSLGVAMLSYHVIEAPFLRRKQRLAPITAAAFHETATGSAPIPA
jgi:peptidoglycan/LPS O-acetylase OafA/YrhL